MTINPGWPVAIALLSLLVVTVAANRVAQLRLGRESVVAGVRAAAQLTLAATIITAVVGTAVFAAIWVLWVP